MRHGRKTRRLLVDGYKRHVLKDLDSGLVRAVGVTLANAPEASVADQIEDGSAELEVFCKAFPVRNGRRFSKVEFQLDWDRLKMRCPNDVVLPFNVRRQGPVPGRGLRQLPVAAAVH